MQKLAFYVGAWSCSGQEIDEDGKVKETLSLDVEVTPRLGGAWLAVVVLVKGQRVSEELKGYDPRDQRFHHLWAAEGGEWGELESPGWEGEKLVFVSAMGAGAHERMTFERVDDAHFVHSAESETSSGWRLDFVKDCKKR